MKRNLTSGLGDLPPMRKPPSGGGGSGGGAARDMMQMYAIYGSDEWQTVAFLSFHAAAFAAASVALLLYFDPIVASAHSALPALPLPALRLAAGLSGSLAGLSSLCLLYAAASLLRSSLLLRWDMALRMLSSVPDWSTVRTALDVGCGRGVLLNAVALRLKKQGSSGRVVGLDSRRDVAVAALRRAGAEGVQEYVTCREGDARALPFPDAHFDVVVSAVHLSAVAREPAERGRALCEMVRVLKPGGVGVVWDIACVPEMAQRLREMRMDQVRISERVTAFLAASHILSFRKPTTAAAHEWTANIC